MQNIWLLLRVPYQAFLAQLRDELAQAGFPDVYPTHTGCVFAHMPPQGIRLSELAARAGLRKQTIAYFVDYLEARGYLERLPDPADRRGKLIRPTERGKAVDRVAREAIAHIQGTWTTLLGPDQMGLLEELLRNLNQVLAEAGFSDDALTWQEGGSTVDSVPDVTVGAV